MDNIDLDVRKIQLLMQLRAEGITDTRVLSAVERIDREKFVPENFKAQAYDNVALPIATGQTISQPGVVAKMTSLLDSNDRMRVLEIGTGSGYQAAILSKLFRMVFSVEIRADLLSNAERIFKDMNINNINTKHANGRDGWKSAAPFDRIIITAAGKKIPEPLIEQLSDGGIIVAPVGDNVNGQKIIRLVKNNDEITSEELLPVKFVPLI